MGKDYGIPSDTKADANDLSIHSIKDYGGDLAKDGGVDLNAGVDNIQKASRAELAQGHLIRGSEFIRTALDMTPKGFPHAVRRLLVLALLLELKI